MKTFFDIITWFFLFLSIIVGLFLLRWEILFSWDVYLIIKNILLPGYLIITWLMVWYLVASIRSKQNSDEKKVYSKSFVIGIVVWVVLALVYMFL
jgi:hypothetical protein